MSDLFSSIYTLESGLKAQSKRLSIITQNLSNKETVSSSKGGEPYRRQLIFFRNKFDRKLNANLVEVYKYDTDRSEFKLSFVPNHPAADDSGYVKYPNVDSIVENADAKEVEISYESIMSALQSTKLLIMKTIDIIGK